MPSFDNALESHAAGFASSLANKRTHPATWESARKMALEAMQLAAKLTIEEAVAILDTVKDHAFAPTIEGTSWNRRVDRVIERLQILSAPDTIAPKE